MPLILTRKQSMRLGLGLLASFFIVSGLIIRFRNSPRLPASSTDLTQAQVQGTTSGAAPSGGLGFVLNDFHRSLERDGKLVWDIAQSSPPESQSICPSPGKLLGPPHTPS